MQIPLSVDFQKQSAVQQQVVQYLRGLILEGAFTPGSKVPSTRSLSEQLSVSRGSVVLAYHHLGPRGTWKRVRPPRHSSAAACRTVS